MRVSAEGWEVEVDLDKTADYYNKLDKEDLLKCCLYCKNFFYGIRKSSGVLIDFLLKLGIVPEKTAHLSELTKISDNKHEYDVDYLFSGKIITKPASIETTSENNHVSIRLTELSDGMYFHFTGTSHSYLGINLCPEPVIGLKLVCEVPWVLDELPD